MFHNNYKGTLKILIITCNHLKVLQIINNQALIVTGKHYPEKTSKLSSLG